MNVGRALSGEHAGASRFVLGGDALRGSASQYSSDESDQVGHGPELFRGAGRDVLDAPDEQIGAGINLTPQLQDECSIRRQSGSARVAGATVGSVVHGPIVIP